jgi:hypothetical protein
MSAFHSTPEVSGGVAEQPLIANVRERQDKLAKDRRCKSTAE